jgi:hypothetical protein
LQLRFYLNLNVVLWIINIWFWFAIAANGSSYRKHFPKPEDFAKAIYTFDIGQNDIAEILSKVGKEDSHALISNIVENFSTKVQVSDRVVFFIFWYI